MSMSDTVCLLSFLTTREIVTSIAGERTPAAVRMSGHPASIPAHWTMCKTLSRFRAAVAHFEEGDPETQTVEAEKSLMSVSRAVEHRNGSHGEGEWYVALPLAN